MFIRVAPQRYVNLSRATEITVEGINPAAVTILIDGRTIPVLDADARGVIRALEKDSGETLLPTATVTRVDIKGF